MALALLADEAAGPGTATHRARLAAVSRRRGGAACRTTSPAAWSAFRRAAIDEFGLPALAMACTTWCWPSTTPSIGPGSSRRAFPRRSRPAASRGLASGSISFVRWLERAAAVPHPRSRQSARERSPRSRSRPAVRRARLRRPDEQLLGRRLSRRRPAGDRLHPRRRHVSGEPGPAAAVSRGTATRSRSICGCGSAIPAPFAGYFDLGDAADRQRLARAVPQRPRAAGRSPADQGHAPPHGLGRGRPVRRRRAAGRARRTAPRT